MAANNAGVWGIRSLDGQTTPASAASTLVGFQTQANTALAATGVVGYGLRFQWQALEFGRVRTTGTVSSGASIPIAATGVTIPNGTVLSFDFGAGMSGSSPVVVTLSAQSNPTDTSLAVVNVPASIGSGSRAGIYNDGILNTAYGWTQTAGKKFKPRVMGGRWVPANVAADGSTTYVETAGAQVGNTAHQPYIDAGGSPNLVFEKAYTQLIRHLRDWALTKTAGTVAMIDSTNYSMQYSEMYYGPYLQALFGGGTGAKNRMVDAHIRLVDIAVANAGGIPVSFGLSGQGPLDDIIAPGVAAHCAALGPYSALVYPQANGWGYSTAGNVGEWGTTVSTEASFDANVWSKTTRRAVQDISPPTARQLGNWIAMFDDIDALPLQKATYAEIYTFQFGASSVPSFNASTAVLNEMLAEIAAWVPASEPGTHQLGQSAETDTAVAFTETKRKLTGEPAETDTAQTLGRVKSRTLGVVTENQTAQPLGKAKVKAFTFAAIETSAGMVLGRSKAKGLGLGAEFDVGNPFGRSKAKGLGLGEETDSAGSVTLDPLHMLNFALETDSGMVLGKSKTKATQQISEVDAATAFGKAKARVFGRAATSDSQTDAATYTTQTLVPGQDRWLVIDVANGTASGTAGSPVLTGLGLSFTQESTIVQTTRRLTRFYARLGSTPTSGTITIDFAGVVQSMCDWSIYELTGLSVSDPFVQSDAKGATATSVSHTLAAFASPNNRALIATWHGANEVTTEEVGYTNISDRRESGTPPQALAVSWNANVEDTTPSYSWSTSSGYRSIASELNTLTTAGIARTPTTAEETDAAFPFGRGKGVTIGLTGETDTAAAMGRAKARLLFTIEEFDESFEVVPTFPAAPVPVQRAESGVQGSSREALVRSSGPEV